MGSFKNQLTPRGGGGRGVGVWPKCQTLHQGGGSGQSVSLYFEKVYVKSRSVNLTKKREKMGEKIFTEAKKRDTDEDMIFFG